MTPDAPKPANEWLTVVEGDDGSLHVLARRLIPEGEVVFHLPKVFTTERDRHSIEVGPNRHQAYTDDIDDYINHSCGPNLELVVVDRDQDDFAFRTLRPIAPGEEVNWDYETFETELSSPFPCFCGSENCRKMITGRRQP
jgi:hypothetical protein